MCVILHAESAEKDSPKKYFRVVAFKIYLNNSVIRIDFQLFLLVKITQYFSNYYGSAWGIVRNLFFCLKCACATVIKIISLHQPEISH